MNVRYIAFIALLVSVRGRAMEENFEWSSSDDFEYDFSPEGEFHFSPGSAHVYIPYDPDMKPDISLNMIVWQLLKEQRETNKLLKKFITKFEISQSLSCRNLNSDFKEEEPKEEPSPNPQNGKSKSIGALFRKLKRKRSLS